MTPRAREFLALAVFWVVAIPLHAEACSTPDVMLVYPPQASISNILGDVIVHIEIGADGAPQRTSLEGKPIPFLAAAALEEVSKIRYPVECAGEVIDLEFSYRKEDGIGPLNPGTSTRVGPNHFQVVTTRWTTDQQAVTTMVVGKRRFWHWLFRRKPST